MNLIQLCIRISIIKYINLFLLASLTRIQGTVLPEHIVYEHISKMNPLSRPLSLPNQALEIVIGMEITQIMEVSTTGNYIAVSGFFRMMWKNNIVSWDPDKFQGVQSVNIERNDIWTPDIFVYTSMSENFEVVRDIGMTRLKVSYDGGIQWLFPIAFKTNCQLNFDNFPQDQQHCILKFGPVYDDVSEMYSIESTLAVITSQYTNSTEWEIVSTNQTHHIHFIPNSNQNVSLVELNLVLKRKSLYSYAYYILPCLLYLGMLFPVFFMPVETNERVSLGIVLCLTLAIMLNYTSVRLVPKTEELFSITALLLAIIIEAVLAILASVITIRVYYSKSSHKWLPAFLDSRFIPQYLRWNELKIEKEKNNVDLSLLSKRRESLMANLLLYVNTLERHTQRNSKSRRTEGLVDNIEEATGRNFDASNSVKECDQIESKHKNELQCILHEMKTIRLSKDSDKLKEKFAMRSASVAYIFNIAFCFMFFFIFLVTIITFITK